MADPETSSDTVADAPATPQQAAHESFSSAQEGTPTGEFHPLSEAEAKARSGRNLAIALGVVVFIVLIFSTTVMRLTQNIEANREAGERAVVTDQR